MNRAIRTLWLALAVAAGGVPQCPGALAQEAPGNSAPAPVPFDRAGKQAGLVEKLGLINRLRKALVEGFVKRSNGSAEERKEIETFFAAPSWKPLRAVLGEEIGRGLDERALDEVLAQLDGDVPSREAARTRLGKPLQAVEVWIAKFEQGTPREPTALDKRLEETMERSLDGVDAPQPRLKRDAQECAAIATLRNIRACQEQLQVSGLLDTDKDDVGEFGTLLELTASVPLRAGFVKASRSAVATSDFSRKGSPLKPPMASPILKAVDANGILTKIGYCFRVYLPDSSNPAGFTHETGPAKSVGLAGGTGKVGVDDSETTWCAYAWPARRGWTGTRVFFISQDGIVLVSTNAVAMWSGTEKPPDPGSAFVGPGIKGRQAYAVKGNDGDEWLSAQ